MINFSEVEANKPLWHERHLQKHKAEINFAPVHDRQTDYDDAAKISRAYNEFKDIYIQIIADKLQRAIANYPVVVKHGLESLCALTFEVEHSMRTATIPILHHIARGIVEESGLNGNPTYICFIEIVSVIPSRGGTQYVAEIY